MESDKRRQIRSGTEFDSLFPQPTGKDHRIKRSADVEDTLALIRETVPQTLWHTEKIARILNGSTLEETCANIWHFVYDHIQYKKDEDGVEQIRSPRRTWWERDSGVDCDCYSEFISSILFNLRVPHYVRITKYAKKPPDVPRWQHIYPVVPRNGKLTGSLSDRDGYIVIDCVKNAFDDEEPFIDHKDYTMRLDYLDGIQDDATAMEEDSASELMGAAYAAPDSVDLADIASVYEGEEMGNIFKKIAKAHQKVFTKVAEGHKKVFKTVAKKGIHLINRYTNPGTILLRNGFLLATKVNLFNIGGRLRYAYLTDEQAKARGINLDVLQKVRKIKDKAEKIYYDAGGNKSNFKKAVLKGRGNKKGEPVPMNGLGGFDDTVYADMQEYNIINSDDTNLNGLGEVATGASIAAAMAAVGAVAGALKQVKGLFSKGGKEEGSFQSETDNAGSAADATSAAATSEDDVRSDSDADTPSSNTGSSSLFTNAMTAARTASALLPDSSSSSSLTTQSPSSYETPASAEDTARDATPDSATVPGIPATAGRNTVTAASTPSTLPAVTSKDPAGFIQKTTGWIKDNPGKSLAIAGALVGSGFLLLRSLGARKHSSPQGMSGLPSPHRKRKNKKKSAYKKHKRRGGKRNPGITFTKLL